LRPAWRAGRGAPRVRHGDFLAASGDPGIVRKHAGFKEEHSHRELAQESDTRTTPAIRGEAALPRDNFGLRISLLPQARRMCYFNSNMLQNQHYERNHD